MNFHGQRLLLIGFIFCLVIGFLNSPVQAQEDPDQPVIRAILFYSPTCSHCENVIQNELPPLIDQYGDQLKNCSSKYICTWWSGTVPEYCGVFQDTR